MNPVSTTHDPDAKILAGAERWRASGGRNGALVLHGFTGSPHSVRGLGQAFHRAGLSVDVPRLPGHGTTLADMAGTSWNDWCGAADDAYRSLAAACERVVVAGLSMGGALALWLAAEHEAVAGVVVVNPLVDAEALNEARQGAAALIAAGEVFLPGIGNDIAKPGVVEVAYDGAPASCVISVLDGVAGLRHRLSQIHTPLLLVHSTNDHVIPRASRELLEAEYGGRVEVVELDRSFHVATLDYDAAEIERRAVEFASGIVGTPVDPASAA